MSTTLHCDVLIAGGGVGGVAAAHRMSRYGLKVILTEETTWIGAQLTSQAVPPDEHGWLESFGCTAAHRDFRNRVRQYVRDHYPVRPEFREDPFLNPGNGWVSPLCHEPTTAHAVLCEMLEPYRKTGRLDIRTGTRVREVTREGKHLRSAILENLEDGSATEVRFRYVLDATENGDLLPLSDTSHVTGSEARAMTGEPAAGDTHRPDNLQAFSWCFVVEHHGGRDHVIPEPESYPYWRDYIPKLQPPWPGKLLSWTTPNPRTLETQTYRFDPHREEMGFLSGLWSFRRILDRSLYQPGAFASDRCLVNWPMIDYLDGHLLSPDSAARERHLRGARELSRSLLYWLQTEAPRPDGGSGWPGLRPCPESTGTPDGFAMAPYIRESRRIRALATITEDTVSAALRPGETYGARWEDSVGIGYYRIDLHPSTGGDNYVDVLSLPFQIPLRSLVPVETENLLPAAKNIGTTHITNGCYRLHPVEWNIGESAAALAAFCLRENLRPREVAQNPRKRQSFQKHLAKTGVELDWPDNLNLDHSDPHRHAMTE